MPVYQDITRPVGHYEMQDQLDYLRTLQVFTDAKDVITSVGVIGCD